MIDPSLTLGFGVTSAGIDVSVRAARQPSRKEAGMSDPTKQQRKSSLRCRLGLHRDVKATNDEGGRYLVCARCGRESFPPDSAGPRIVA